MLLYWSMFEFGIKRLLAQDRALPQKPLGAVCKQEKVKTITSGGST